MEGQSGSDWRSRHGNVNEQMWFLCQNGVKTDLQITVSSGQRMKIFKCHKIFIIRLSSVFENLIEASDKDEEGKCITISAFDPDLFPVVLKFAYTDLASLHSVKAANELRNFCIKYNILRLKSVCELYMCNHLDVDTIWDILDEPNKPAQMAIKIKEFLSKNTKQCLKSLRFVSCSHSSLLNLLKTPALEVDELTLVKAVHKWTIYHNKSRPVNAQIAKRLLGPCLQFLRFLALSPVEFSQHVAPSGLLSAEESLAILVNLNSPGQMTLPDNICMQTVHRNSPSPRELSRSPNREAPKETPKKSNGLPNEAKNGMAKDAGPSKQAASQVVAVQNGQAAVVGEPGGAKEGSKSPKAINGQAPKGGEASKSPTLVEVAVQSSSSDEEGQKKDAEQRQLQNTVAAVTKVCQTLEKSFRTLSPVFAKTEAEPPIADMQICVMRGKQPSMNNFSSEFNAPLEMQMEFYTNRRLFLTAVKLMRQVNCNQALHDSYYEDLHLEICSAATNKVISKQRFTELIEYGPAPFEVKLSKKVQIETHKNYLVKVSFKSKGVYLSDCRSMTCLSQAISVHFSSQSLCKGLLHSLVFQP